MSLASYSDLKAAVARWLRRSDLSDVIPDLIVLAEATMNRELRTALQLVRQPFTITAELVTKPTGFRMMRALRLTDFPSTEVLEWTPEEMARNKAKPTQVQGFPRRYSAVGSQLEFWPYPDKQYQALITFQAGFTPLSDAHPVNWILADHPDAYLYGALSEGSAFAKNFDSASAWKDEFERVIGEIQHALVTTYDRKLRCDPAIVATGRRRADLLIFQSGQTELPGSDTGGGFDFSDPDNSSFLGN